MLYGLMAWRHYLNQCWFIIKWVVWNSTAINFTRSVHDLNQYHVLRDNCLLPHLPGPGANYMMTSSNGNISHVNGPLWGESTGHQWFPLTKWQGGLMFSLICAWANGWANNQDASDLRPHRNHYDVTVMIWIFVCRWGICWQYSWSAVMPTAYGYWGHWLIGHWEICMKSKNGYFQANFNYWLHGYLFWKCPHVIVTGPHWW